MKAFLAGFIAVSLIGIGFAVGQKIGFKDGEAKANGVCKIICEERK
jgi:hypothetical protein